MVEPRPTYVEPEEPTPRLDLLDDENSDGIEVTSTPVVSKAHGLLKFGWCIDGNHKRCRVEIPGSKYKCMCDCGEIHGSEPHPPTPVSQMNANFNAIADSYFGVKP